jgi:hypothetical protein
MHGSIGNGLPGCLHQRKTSIQSRSPFRVTEAQACAPRPTPPSKVGAPCPAPPSAPAQMTRLCWHRPDAAANAGRLGSGCLDVCISGHDSILLSSSASIRLTEITIPASKQHQYLYFL